MRNRGSGILLHVISLPSPFGIGDLGPGAMRFADFLDKTGQSYWQVLPLSPTDPARGNIPYSSASAFAGNPLLVSPELLAEEGLLRRSEIEPPQGLPRGEIDYERVIPYKHRLLDLAWERFRAGGDGGELEKFCRDNGYWLDDYALFAALKERFGGVPWDRWPVEVRDRHHDALDRARHDLHEAVEKEKFRQHLFFRQWSALKKYCNDRGIGIIGDIPIYVDHDSVDVWTNPDHFKLDAEKRPLFVSGVPPDYFSETGQLWGTPVYDWEHMRKDRYGWWVRRFGQNFRLFDLVRIDHFRGFVAYWEIESGEKTARTGRWVECPVEDFFETLLDRFDNFPIIAEDLGVITPDVKAVMERFGFPGMKVLLFAFGADLPTNPYAPHNHVQGCIIYPGTHDNNTVRGWFDHGATIEEKERFSHYVGREVAPHEAHWEMIRLAWMSVSDRAIASMQDLLGLGDEARINTPATVEGNYRWRMSEDQMAAAPAEKLLMMTEIYGRKAWGAQPAPA